MKAIRIVILISYAGFWHRAQGLLVSLLALTDSEAHRGFSLFGLAAHYFYHRPLLSDDVGAQRLFQYQSYDTGYEVESPD